MSTAIFLDFFLLLYIISYKYIKLFKIFTKYHKLSAKRVQLFRLSIVIMFILFFFICVPYLESQHDAKNFTFVGSKVCKECHVLDGIGNQYKIWETSPHAKAYKKLLTGNSIEIAKKNNITAPEQDYQCLKCHATGKGSVKEIVEEGVGCESCHGPGSEYHHASNHVNYNNRSGGYATAIKNGMYPILGIESLKLREKLCLSCHQKGRPCYPKGTRDIYKFHIPIQVIDSLQKGEVNFKHNVK